ncbi:MAG: ribonuclease [Rhizobium sp. 63-7]|nr:ribonuclease [Hyphomicrobiales bacterium]OJT99566.1 MAG: ribonuclease [Rhizobium sp. 63-7]
MRIVWLALCGIAFLCLSCLSSLARDGRTTFILAASWQPAFCEGRNTLPECRSQTADRDDASRFSLHGLWRMRQSYCGVAEADKARDKQRGWLALPPVALPEALAGRLAGLMPGAQSGLDRHEWLKHGTCSNLDQSGYFGLSVSLMEELNASAVGQLFRDRIGKLVREAEVKAAFAQAFGAGAGERVRMSCREDGGRRLVVELTIGLGGELKGDAGLAERIAAAGSTKFGCPEGEVDAAGFQ